MQAWRASPPELALDQLANGTLGRFFAHGLLNNLANPKMIAFFLALFPHFIRPDHGSVALQSLLLGMTLAAMTLIWLGVVILAVARARAVAVRRRPFVKIVHRLAALAFFGLACRLAVEER